MARIGSQLDALVGLKKADRVLACVQVPLNRLDFCLLQKITLEQLQRLPVADVLRNHSVQGTRVDLLGLSGQVEGRCRATPTHLGRLAFCARLLLVVSLDRQRMACVGVIGDRTLLRKVPAYEPFLRLGRLQTILLASVEARPHGHGLSEQVAAVKGVLLGHVQSCGRLGGESLLSQGLSQPLNLNLGRHFDLRMPERVDIVSGVCPGQLTLALLCAYASLWPRWHLMGLRLSVSFGFLLELLFQGRDLFFERLDFLNVLASLVFQVSNAVSEL